METKMKTALVTGASSGIGRETALMLADKGFHVIAAARRLDRLTELSERFERIHPMQVDLSDPKDTQRFSGEISAFSDPVSVLVNAAGYSVRGALEDVSQEAVRRIFEVNLFSLMQVTRACLPGMRKQREGTIVNLSSISGKFAFPLSSVYSATKYALEAVSDALRMELRPFGIRVIVVRPGVIATEFHGVANEMSGDPAGRTDEDYKKVYQAVGAGVGKMFIDLRIPGPALIAKTIVDAVLSKAPKAAYAAGPFTEDILEERFALDDDAFDRFWTDKLGLKDISV
ncbi:MAG: SDR family NAD(P)-dependent oxidoreductase [Deltaproteobacteria bacterium]|nr:SDR family NAD(P)-dependent oxidoreductase [Deltaproteobacteria bacterium]